MLRTVKSTDSRSLRKEATVNEKIESLPNGDFKVVYKNVDEKRVYVSFFDWFHEVENYGMRSERFYEEFQTLGPQRAVEWMQTAWRLGAESKSKDDIRNKFDSECG
jgi:hypothetical protein